ncbi:hydroxymethylpyrimidine/phosphomethylpyrimidine kinase [Sphingomonas laterariae]|uniref:hydroxymethylpyrimidine kinase n=1 Tax=Edaphosphingomonas laterariae TaxID=861865 RepID=A0A239HDB1_9SPHN|nr:bifunctional hydroxymethylpyrimidine kinase/phosphomethylpyrimidine kinase [Sphingomonas laterariae]SNS78244.1 hydroxymethylpyrimidine/phosphomethylpyrimidine kinase [Sphingomonas laterariae]
MTIARVLIIAGSDSGGGAGIQADIRTVTMLGGHPMTAIAAITAQNTLGVTAVHPVPTDMVIAQIDAVAADIGVDAVKIGMIGSAETASAVADRLEAMGDVPIVFDPVMIASSGAVLADEATIAAFARLMKIATVATPNAPELAALTGLPVTSMAEAAIAATRLFETHGCAVLAKGGHLPPVLRNGREMVGDLLVHEGAVVEYWNDRIETRNSHGTGCTLASGIATGLATGLALQLSVDRARDYLRAALAAAPGLGAGHGPMGHALGGVPFDVMSGLA